jgi:hypothetical protein
MTASMLPGLTFEQYTALPGINWSKLKHGITSAAHLAAALDGALDDPDTSSRGMLRACHAAALEPEVFDRDFTVADGRRTAAAKAEAQTRGQTLLTEAEHDHAIAVGAAVRAHPVAGPLLRNGSLIWPELSLTWEEAGETYRARLDLLRVDCSPGPDGWVGVTIADLKAVPSISPRRLAAEVARRHYHAQLAHYAAGWRAVAAQRPDLAALPVRCLVIAYEARPIVDVGVYELDPDVAMYAGEAVRAEAIARLPEARGSRPPGQAPAMRPLHLPAWAFGEDDDATDAYKE